MPNTVTINGKRWRLIFTSQLGDCRGICDHPDAVGKRIRIRNGLPREELIEVLLHELLHAADWSKGESWVERTACDLARVLEQLIQEGRIRGEET
jgi:hypothetical protein